MCQTMHADVRKYIHSYQVELSNRATGFVINERNSGDTSLMKTVNCVTTNYTLHVCYNTPCTNWQVSFASVEAGYGLETQMPSDACVKLKV